MLTWILLCGEVNSEQRGAKVILTVFCSLTHTDRRADQQPPTATVSVQQCFLCGQHGQHRDSQPTQQTQGDHQDPRQCQEDSVKVGPTHSRQVSANSLLNRKPWKGQLNAPISPHARGI